MYKSNSKNYKNFLEIKMEALESVKDGYKYSLKDKNHITIKLMVMVKWTLS